MKLRWGVAGIGPISHDFITALATLPFSDHKLIAIAGKDLEKVQQFAILHHVKKAYEEYEHLAKDENIDIIYIGLSNPDHFNIAQLMLSHGKHVLCEKPLCLNYKETMALTNYAENKNLLLVEGMWSRFFPVYEALDKHLKSNGLGEVLQLNAEFGVPISDKERFQLKTLGGGTTMDLGIYLIQLAQLVFKDEPIKIVCNGHLDDQGIDESMSCILTYNNGRTATLTAHSKVLLTNKAEIIGTNGIIKLNTFWAPTVLQTSAADITIYQLPHGMHRFNFHNSAGLSYEAEECRQCIKNGLIESPKMTHAESLMIIKIIDNIQQQLGVTTVD